MSKPYKITMNDLEKSGGVTRLMSDGHTKSDIMTAIHRETDCREFGHKTRTDQRELVSKLFDRSNIE